MSAISGSHHYSTAATTAAASSTEGPLATAPASGQSMPKQPHSPLPIHPKPPLLARAAFIDWNAQALASGSGNSEHGQGSSSMGYGPPASSHSLEGNNRVPSFNDFGMPQPQEHHYASQQQAHLPSQNSTYVYDPYFVTPPASTSPLNSGLAHDYYTHPQGHASSPSSQAHATSDYHNVSLPPFQMAYTMRAGSAAEKDAHHLETLQEAASLAPRMNSMQSHPPYMAVAYPSTYLPCGAYPPPHFPSLPGYIGAPQSIGYALPNAHARPSVASPVHSTDSGGGSGSAMSYDRSHPRSPSFSLSNSNRKARSIRPRYQCPTCGLFTPFANYPLSLGNSPYYGGTMMMGYGKGSSSSSLSSQCCQNCSTRRTPLWRKNDRGHTLCNACGLYERIHKRSRPIPPSLTLGAEMDAPTSVPYPMAMYANGASSGHGLEAVDASMQAQWAKLGHISLMKEYCVRWWRCESEWRSLLSSKVDPQSSSSAHAATSSASYAISNADLESWSNVLEAQLRAIQEAISKRHEEEQHAVFDSFIE